MLNQYRKPEISGETNRTMTARNYSNKVCQLREETRQEIQSIRDNVNKLSASVDESIKTQHQKSTHQVA